MTQPSEPSIDVTKELPPISGSGAGVPLAATEDQLETIESGRFSAFTHRNFRLFWIGNLLSLMGTFAQQTAQGWLVRSLTPNEFIITAVAACGTAPLLVLTLFAGAMADRVDKRRALMALNLAAAVLACVLAALVHLGAIRIWHIALISLVTGVVNAFDIPTRQSFNVEMVGRKDLPNAIALNSSAFNGARVAGPMAGGLLLHIFGVVGCFLANALSYFALIFNLSRMNTPRVAAPGTPLRLADVREGCRFVYGNRTLRFTVMLVAWVSLWALSYSPLLPVFAKDVYGSNEQGFALLVACNGLGALTAALGQAFSRDMRHRGKRVVLGAFGFSLSVIAFGASPGLYWGCAALFLAGWFLLIFLMTANTLVQTISPDDLRGRVFSVYSLAVVGTQPLGALTIGALARLLGSPGAVRLGGAVAALFTIFVWWRFRELWKEK